MSLPLGYKFHEVRDNAPLAHCLTTNTQQYGCGKGGKGAVGDVSGNKATSWPFFFLYKGGGVCMCALGSGKHDTLLSVKTSKTSTCPRSRAWSKMAPYLGPYT